MEVRAIELQMTRNGTKDHPHEMIDPSKFHRDITQIIKMSPIRTSQNPRGIRKRKKETVMDGTEENAMMIPMMT